MARAAGVTKLFKHVQRVAGSRLHHRLPCLQCSVVFKLACPWTTASRAASTETATTAASTATSERSQLTDDAIPFRATTVPPELIDGFTVGITGSEGGVGSVLRRTLAERGYNIVAVTSPDADDLTPPPSDSSTASSSQASGQVLQRRADLRNNLQVYGLFDGCDAVIHLAALPKPWEPWRAVYDNNILIDHHVFEEAARVQLSRLVIASSCHTQHGLSMGASFETLNHEEWGRHIPGGKLLRLHDVAWPSSHYGAAKMYSEHIARLYALECGLSTLAVRIGWLTPEDDPSAVGDSEKPFMRGLYLSHRDATEIFSRALHVDLPDNFAAVYASSANGRSFLDRESSEILLGYRSQDDAETFYRTAGTR